jgi:hypothetical protein
MFSAVSLRGWIHGSNNDDLSKRPCTYFAHKKTYLEQICGGQSGQNQMGDPWMKRKEKNSKKFSDFNQNRNDRKFCTDSKNIYINWC